MMQDETPTTMPPPPERMSEAATRALGSWHELRAFLSELSQARADTLDGALLEQREALERAFKAQAQVLGIEVVAWLDGGGSFAPKTDE